MSFNYRKRLGYDFVRVCFGVGGYHVVDCYLCGGVGWGFVLRFGYPFEWWPSMSGDGGSGAGFFVAFFVGLLLLMAVAAGDPPEAGDRVCVESESYFTMSGEKTYCTGWGIYGG